MLASLTATCPNPTLLGPTLSPIEMTPIESSPYLIREPRILPFSSLAITNPIIGISFGIAFGVAWITTTYIVKSFDLAKVSRIAFPSGSEGARIKDEALQNFQNVGLWKCQISFYRLILTDPEKRTLWNLPAAVAAPYLTIWEQYADSMRKQRGYV